MTVTVHAPTTAAPPADAVSVALADPGQLSRLSAHARAILRGRYAEDAVQEVCRRALANRAGYDPERGSVGTWLAGVTANVCRELLRADARHPVPSDMLDHLVVARTERESDLADIRFRVERFLTRLPPDERAAVKLRHLDELEYPEIAARLGITPLYARQRVCRGLNRLRQMAGNTVGEEQP